MRALHRCLLMAVVVGCSGEDSAESKASDAGPETAVDAGAFDGAPDSGVDAAPADAAAEASEDGGAVVDPTQTGPLQTVIYTANVKVAATGSDVPVRCHLPAEAGQWPLLVILHGFQLPASQYDATAKHVASFGFVSCTLDYPAGFVPNHAAATDDVMGGIDFLLGASAAAGNPLSDHVLTNAIGVSGHSLGGKLSVLAAARDARIKALVALDPVDSAMSCNPTACPDASDLMPLPIPTAFLGETLDATGTLGQACAPKADNYQTFFAGAQAPSLEVTLLGANHMSFIDSPTTCGVVCSFCKTATLPQAKALEVTRAYLVAFFSRHLKQAAGYDAWLTGTEAQQRWVAPGTVSLKVEN
ncbi:MAG: hypothetical protein R3B13_05825 [Polyangiaceae bacterium]